MTRRQTRRILDDVSDWPHPYRRERSPVAFGSGAIMAIEQIIGFAVLAQLAIATLLYSMGYRDGKSVGYHHGRSVGMAIGKTKAAK